MKKVMEFIEKYQMIADGDRIIAGISGGPDSVCLFFVLLSLRIERNIFFAAVHVNHGMRGLPADEDERFVRSLCEKYAVPLIVSRVDLESIAKKRKQSPEEAGRFVRREAFEAARKQFAADKIALAHHQNDNAETLLWNLSRGTGLAGLGGIRPVNGIYIRPLLCMERAEIEKYLSERALDFCTDETNAQTDYTRNRIRHLILPVLEEQVNKRAVRHMNAAMEQVWELQDYMDLQAEEALLHCTSWDVSGEGLLLGQRLDEYPHILKKMVIQKCLQRVSGRKKDWGRTHIEAVAQLFQKQTGSRQILPYAVCALRVYEGIRLEKNYGIRQEEIKPAFRAELCVPGETVLLDKNLKICCSVFQKPFGFKMENIPQKINTKWFDYAIMKNNLVVRTRQDMDRIVVDRQGHSQKLKSWFINEKIPARQRDSLLLIADGNQIVWILGQRISSAYYVSDRTQRILEIKVMEEKHDGRDSKSTNNREGDR